MDNKRSYFNDKQGKTISCIKRKHKLLNNIVDNLTKSPTGLWEDSKSKELKVEKLKIKTEIERIQEWIESTRLKKAD